MTNEQSLALLDLGSLVAEIQTEISELKDSADRRLSRGRVERCYGLCNALWLVLERLHHPSDALLDGAGPAAVNGKDKLPRAGDVLDFTPRD